jgi:hypothetical protein
MMIDAYCEDKQTPTWSFSVKINLFLQTHTHTNKVLRIAIFKHHNLFIFSLVFLFVSFLHELLQFRKSAMSGIDLWQLGVSFASLVEPFLHLVV